MSQGAPATSFVTVPHPMGMIPLPEIRKKAEEAFPEIFKAMTEWQPKGELPPPKPSYPAERFKLKGTHEDVNNYFYKKGWSLGLQIVPPTSERVAAMLKGTSRSPSEVIGAVPPREGILTVELAAACAVMAGAKPEYMPVILAAAEAMIDPLHGWRGSTTTTNPVAPLLVVNGPIVKDLGIQFSTGALAGGPFSHPNISIGYAINLIGDIVGGSKPPSPDQSTLGQTANIIAMVLGENEKANPWSPFQVELGFSPDTSIVTLFAVRTFANNNLHDVKTGRDLLAVIGEVMGSAGGVAETTKPCAPGNRELLVLSPEHAALVAQDGLSKAEAKRLLYESSKIPRQKLELRYSANPKKLSTVLDCFKGWENWDRIPLVEKPEDIVIIVAGGPGKHSVYMSTNGYAPVTKVIKK